MDDKKVNISNVKQNPFTVPDGYFQQFNANIMAMLPEKNEVPQKKRTALKKQLISWSVAAAALAGVFFTVKDLAFSPSASTTTAENVQFASQEDREFYLFLEENATQQEFSATYYNVN